MSIKFVIISVTRNTVLNSMRYCSEKNKEYNVSA